MTSHQRSIFIEGPAGQLEALMWRHPGAAVPKLAAVVCHPHPLYGGTMHNKVVYQTAKTLHGCGFPVLRFNFRGVGSSGGSYDEGRGEGEDVSAALDYLRAEFPSVPLLLAGFSFGAWVGLRVGCADHRVTELIGLGLPIRDRKLDFEYLRACVKPKLLIQGERDQYGDRRRFEEFIATLEPEAAAQTRVAFIPYADHFFAGHLDRMSSEVKQWITQRHPGASSGT